MLFRRVGAVLVLLLAGCGGRATSAECEGLTTEQCTQPDGPTLVVDTDWLEAHLGDPDVQLIDTRASGYEASRLPGALHLRPGDLAMTADGVPSHVAPPISAQPVLRAARVRTAVRAVVYG